MRATLARILALSVLLAGFGPAALGQERGAGTERERYVELQRRKERAQRLNALWKLEAELSAKRTAYAVLDLSDRKLYFKVRGRTFKAITYTRIDARRGSRPLEAGDLAWRAFTLLLKEGKGVETETLQARSLTEAEKRAAGVDSGEDEPIGAEQGEVVDGGAAGEGDSTARADRLPGVAGGAIPADPPPKYHMGFDGGLSIWVIADAPPAAESASYNRLLGLARSIGSWIVHPAGGGSEETRIELRLPLPLAQQIYRQLLPGQRLLITQ